MAQLETSVKAQQQDAAAALVQQQEAAAALKHVAEQIAEWRSWKDRDEPLPPRNRNKAEPAQSQCAEQREPDRKPSTVATHRPTRVARRSDRNTSEPEDKHASLQKRQLQDNQYASKACTKRYLPPSLEDQPPAHHASASKRAYTGPQGIYAKLSHPVLAQKTKARPDTPPWRSTREAHWETQPRPPASERATPGLEATAPEETHHTHSPTHDLHQYKGILPPLADFDGKAINIDHPPFDTLSRWEEVPPSKQIWHTQHTVGHTRNLEPVVEGQAHTHSATTHSP